MACFSMQENDCSLIHHTAQLRVEGYILYYRFRAYMITTGIDSLMCSQTHDDRRHTSTEQETTISTKTNIQTEKSKKWKKQVEKRSIISLKIKTLFF